MVTTNKKTALDLALTRPGRIDKQHEFLNPDTPTIESYFSTSFSIVNEKTADKVLTDKVHNYASKFASAVPSRMYSLAQL